MGSHVVEAHDINIRVSIRVGGLSGPHLVFFCLWLYIKSEIWGALGHCGLFVVSCPSKSARVNMSDVLRLRGRNRDFWPEVVSSSCSPWGASLNQVQVMESQGKMIS
jgi:hypothetical protein